MQHTVFNPHRRNISAAKQLEELYGKKAEYVRLQSEKQLELDVISSDISSIEAEIANIMMKKSKRKKRRTQI